MIELWRECVERREERVGLVEVAIAAVAASSAHPYSRRGRASVLAVLQDLTRTAI
jgi:hypothetical protein